MNQRTQQVLQAIDALTRQAGYPPTVREVAAASGLKSSSSGKRHIDLLEHARLVEYKTGLPRTLRLTENGRVCLALQQAPTGDGNGQDHFTNP